jgi:branched-chain amino acid aminotransferase
MIVLLNGKFVTEKKAVVPVSDHGFLYGDGVYETLISFNGRPFRLDEHLRRLGHSARGISLAPPYSLKTIGTFIRRLLHKNGLTQKNAAIRLTLTRGPGPHGFDPRPCKNPTLVITAKPFDGYPAPFYTKGIRVCLVSVRRNSASALPPSIKSTSCLNGILAKMESIRSGAQEGILLSEDGFVAEGTVSNVFTVKNKTVFTPRLDGGLLPGVTRQTVLRIAKTAGYKTLEKRLTPADLVAADEIFITNTLMGIVPVRELVWKGNVRFRARHFPATWHVSAAYKAVTAG